MASALLLPMTASGADLRVTVGTAAEYDSNVYRISDDSDRSKKDDVIFRIVPTALLSSDEGSFTYRLFYSVPFEQGVDSNREISDFDQVGRINLGYRPTDATQFFGSNSTRYSRSNSRQNQQNDSADELIPEANNRRSRVLRNNAEFGITHSFAPRLAGSLRFSHGLFDTQQQNRADNWTVVGSANLNYQLDQKHTVGGGISISHQDFEDVVTLPGSQSTFYNPFLSWVYRFDETTTISLSGGPVVIRTSQDKPPAVVEDFSTYPFVTIEESGGVPTEIGVSNFDNCPPVEGQEGSLGFLTIIGGNDPGCGSLSSLGRLRGDLDPSDPANQAELDDFAKVLTSTTTLTFPGNTRPGSGNDTTVSGFGSASITKRWTPNLASEASYRRQQSAASGIGGSTVMDAVAFTSSWQMTELWDASMRVDWTNRKSVSSSSLETTTAVVEPSPPAGPDALNTFDRVAQVTGTLTSDTPVNNEVNTERWGISFRLGRKITRNLDASLRLSYNKQKSKSRSRGNASDFDNYLAVIGIRYSFHPLEVW